MIDHFEIKVKDLQISEGFYRSFLVPLDYKLAFKTSSLIHFAFLAENKEEVQACYEAGIEASGRDNGVPGYRSEHPIYYAAFMIDLDGNNIEVVCHKE
ncbi:TPA: VOC family protein [Streptococcus pneumoniae]|nr:VOC family protein [Streptococcus pneumoniae]HEV5832802.1 VOC family protein [Streptococcus pneumoniae]HEV5848537.1 VOC family protein [Streptococcus pneumoniae]